MATLRQAWARYVVARGLAARDTVTTNKYHAQPVRVDGVRFASKREARRYQELVALAQAGQIRDLERQPVYPILVPDRWTHESPEHLLRQVGVYTADFRYYDLELGALVVEDVKSAPTKTTAYRLRKRLVEAIHGIKIREV